KLQAFIKCMILHCEFFCTLKNLI
ncbi:unnamed protein product, partial [Callosobruchus maculatus]